MWYFGLFSSLISRLTKTACSPEMASTLVPNVGCGRPAFCTIYFSADFRYRAICTACSPEMASTLVPNVGCGRPAFCTIYFSADFRYRAICTLQGVSFLNIVAPCLTKYLLSWRAAGERLPLLMRDRDRSNKNQIEIFVFSVTSNDFPHDMLLLTFSSNLGSKLWC
jgi:hypothetical protein